MSHKWTQFTLVALALVFGAPLLKAETASEEERRLHRIYESYLAEPVTDEQWNALFSAQQEDIYAIQPGDTLWELSLIFFGDGHYWPKLWSINSRLTNPHLILPGYQIRFLRGPGSVLPQMTLEPSEGGSVPQLWAEPSPNRKEQDTETALAESAEGDSLYLLVDAPEIPAPMYPATPLLKDLPDTFPDGRSNHQYDEVGFSFEERPTLDLTPAVALRSFVSDEPVTTVGEVIEQAGPNEMAGMLQYLYIQSGESVRVGDRFMALGPSSQVGSWSRKGRIYHIYGEIEVTDETTAGENIFRAVVLNSVDGVPAGAKIVREQTPYYSFSPEGRVSNVSAEVMGVRREAFGELYGLGSELYLDRGERDGLMVGDILYLTADRRQRIPKPKVTHAPVYSAVAKIVHTGQDVATGVLVTSYNDIQKGDVSGQSSVPDLIYPQAEERSNIQFID